MIKLTDERIDEIALNVYGFVSTSPQTRRKLARAIEAEVLRINGVGGDGSGPPFGSKRKAAMAIYKPPFKFVRGYIYDSASNMVADQDGFDGKVADAVTASVRGWGRIGYMPNPEELQDEVGQMMADALTAYYATPQPQQAVPGAVLEGWQMVPVVATREMLNSAIDVDSFKLGDISPLGFRCSPQQLFERCYAAMLSAAPKPQGE